VALLAYPPSIAEAWAEIRLSNPITVGWHVYAIQKALNDAAGETLSADGAFGRNSDAAVRDYQARMNLVVDGVVGPATKRWLIEACARRLDREDISLPDGLIRAMARGEGADNPSAINEYDPPGGTKGTDCGIMQLRCYENGNGNYDISDLYEAFSPYDAMRVAAARFKEAKNHYLTYGWTRSRAVRAEKCALLFHNWPVGANDIAFEGRLSNSDAIATWVPSGLHMIDGSVVKTRFDWVCYYAGLFTEVNGVNHQGPMPAAVKWGV
jgi:hypothetical protein